jgi:hypothetical protein
LLQDILFSLGVGGTVGIIGHIRKHGKIIMPRKTKKFIYPGFLEEMLLGAIAALLAVLYLDPKTIVEKLLFSVLAGIGGDTILTKIKLLNSDKQKS